MPGTPPWRWKLWGPWPPYSLSRPKISLTHDQIKVKAYELAERRPWCTAEQNWLDARAELEGPRILSWRPSLLRWIGASDKKGWDWIDLSFKLAVPLAITVVGWYLTNINNERMQQINQATIAAQNKIAQDSQHDSIVREYIKEMKGILMDKSIAIVAREQGSVEHGVARALTLTAISQLKNADPDRKSLIFLFLRDADFPVLGSNDFADETTNSGTSYDVRDEWRNRANLMFVDLHGVILSGTNLRGANLRNANLSNAWIRGADLSGSKLIEAELNGARLMQAKLLNTDLRGSILINADLRQADIRGARLRGADLRSADLRGADLRQADISGADLRGADMRGANLAGVRLSGVDPIVARLREKDFMYASDFLLAGYRIIRWDESTRWPERNSINSVKGIPAELIKQLALK